MSGEAVQVTGLNAFVKGLKQVSDDLPKDMRELGLSASLLVAQAANTFVPVGDADDPHAGALAKSIRFGATRTGAYVSAGSGLPEPYAGPVHFGWPEHNIAPNEFLYEALDERRNDVVDVYDRGMQMLVDKSMMLGAV